MHFLPYKNIIHLHLPRKSEERIYTKMKLLCWGLQNMVANVFLIILNI